MLPDDLTQRLSSLSPAKRALLLQAMRKEAGRSERPQIISRREKREQAPLSFAQQRLWFLSQLEPNTAAFNFPLAARLTGTLRVAALERCFNEIIRRHEILRTTFVQPGEQPVQVINPPAALSLVTESLEHLPVSEREEEAQRLHLIEAQQPFGLSRGPLLRIRLLRLSEREHVLLLTLHHIVWDGWSAGIFVKEVSALYSAFVMNQPSPLPELAIQYADFALWQRQRLQGAALEEHLNYWYPRLRNAPRLELPIKRAGTDRSRGARLSLSVPSELGKAIRDLSRTEGVTTFMTLLAAFKLLLSRYSEQDDVVIGADVANRTTFETEQLIGFFVNQLVLRTNLGENPTFRELLDRVRQVAAGAYAHQDLPFDVLVQKMKVKRNPHEHPFYQVKIVFQNFPIRSLELPELQFELLQMRERVPQLDMILFLWDQDHEVGGQLEYDTGVFSEESMHNLLRHYLRLLESIVTSPDARLDQLEIFTREELEERRLRAGQLVRSNRQKLITTRRTAVDLKVAQS
jgi:Condensation domain